MKLNFEKPKKWLKNTVLGTVATVGMAAPVFGAEKSTKKPAENAGSKTEKQSEKATPEASVDFHAEKERALKIIELQEKKDGIKNHLQEQYGHLDSIKWDFSNRLAEVLGKSGKKNVKGPFIQDQLQTLVMEMGKKYIGKQHEDITSDHSVEVLKGILLDMNGPLGKQMAELADAMNKEGMGSTVHSRIGKLDVTEQNDRSKFIRAEVAKHTGSEDVSQRRSLSGDINEIIKSSLMIVKEEHQLEQVLAEMESLKESNSMTASR